jgi:hypothetical protein
MNLKISGPGPDPATGVARAGSLAVAVLVATALVACSIPTVSARGGWHGGGHGGAAGELNAAGGRRHGNDTYMKAASEERDKLLNSRLKSICRGC